MPCTVAEALKGVSRKPYLGLRRLGLEVEVAEGQPLDSGGKQAGYNARFN